MAIWNISTAEVQSYQSGLWVAQVGGPTNGQTSAQVTNIVAGLTGPSGSNFVTYSITNGLASSITLNSFSVANSNLSYAIGTASTNYANGITVTRSNITATTTGYTWSTSVPSLGALGFQTNQIKLLAMTNLQKVVVLGSSTAYGVGSTGGTNGWADMLRTNLAAKGLQVINASISGTRPGVGTDNGISRFYKDVAVHQPQFVIIAYVIGNEGIDSLGVDDKQIAVMNFQSNRLQLAKMCLAIGAIPILNTSYGRSAFSVADYQMLQECYWQDMASGFKVVDFTAPLDNFQGGMAGAYDSGDGIHPNDAGHKAMFMAIPGDLFSSGNIGSYIYRDNRNAPSTFLAGANTGTLSNMWFTRPPTFQNFTMSMWLRNSTGTTARAFLQPNSLGGIGRLRNPGGGDQFMYSSSSGATIYSGTASEDTKWHHAVLTWSTASNLLYFYWDGNLAGSTTESSFGAERGVANFHGRYDLSNIAPIGYEFKGHGIWRTAMLPWQVKALYQGNVPLASAEVYSPMDDLRTQGYALPPRNVAPTASMLVTTNIDYAASAPIGMNSYVLGDGSILSTAPVTNGLIAGSNMTLTTNGANQVVFAAIGGGGSLTTNANQFGASTALTIKSGAVVTNLQGWSDSTFDNITLRNVDNGGGGGGLSMTNGGQWLRLYQDYGAESHLDFSGDLSLNGNNVFLNAGLQLPSGAVAGYVLTTDNLGVGTWQVNPALGVSNRVNSFSVANSNLSYAIGTASTNYTDKRQGGSIILTNLAATGALTNGLIAGSNMTLTTNGANQVVFTSSGGAASTNLTTLASGSATLGSLSVTGAITSLGAMKITNSLGIYGSSATIRIADQFAATQTWDVYAASSTFRIYDNLTNQNIFIGRYGTNYFAGNLRASGGVWATNVTASSTVTLLGNATNSSPSIMLTRNASTGAIEDSAVPSGGGSSYSPVVTAMANTNIVFSSTNALLTFTLTSNTVFTASGYAAGAQVSLFITGDTNATRTISFPGWTWLEGNLTSATSNKVYRVDITSLGTTATNCIAVYGGQQ
jgi:lysophospholipase L1-like esterase